MTQKPFQAYSKYRSPEEYRAYKKKTSGTNTTIKTPTGTEVVNVKVISPDSPDSLNRVVEANTKASAQKVQPQASNTAVQQSRATTQYEQVSQAINRQSVDPAAAQRNSPVPGYYVQDELRRESRPLYQKEVSQGGSPSSNVNPTDRYAPVKVYKQTPSGSELVGVADWKDVKVQEDLNSSNDKLGNKNGQNKEGKSNDVLRDINSPRSGFTNWDETNSSQSSNNKSPFNNSSNLSNSQIEKDVTRIEKRKLDITTRTENTQDFFRVVPGLKGDNFVQKSSRYALAVPTLFTVGLADQMVLNADITYTFAKEFRNNPSIRPVIKEEIGRATKETVYNMPKTIVRSFNPITPEGLVNLGLVIIPSVGSKSSSSLRAIEKEIAKAEKGKVELKGEYDLQETGTFRDNVYMEGAKVKTSTITAREKTTYGVLETNKLDVVDVITDSNFQRNFMLKDKPASTKIQVTQDFATGDVTVVKMNKGKIVYEKTTKGKIPEQPKITRQSPMVYEKEFIAGEKGVRTETQITPFQAELPKGFLRGFEKSQVYQEAKVVKPQRELDFGVNIKETGEIKNPQTAKRNTKTFIEFTKDNLKVKKDVVQYDSIPDAVKTSELRQSRAKTTNVESNNLKAYYSNMNPKSPILEKINGKSFDIPNINKGASQNILQVKNEQPQILEQKSVDTIQVQAVKTPVSNSAEKLSSSLSSMETSTPKIGTSNKFKLQPVFNEEQQATINIQQDKADIYQSIRTSPRTKPLQINISSQIQSSEVVSSQVQSPAQISDQIQTPAQIQTPDQISSQIQTPAQIPTQVQTPVQIQTPAQVQTQIQTPVQITTPIQTPKIPFPKIPRIKMIKTPKIRVMFPIPASKSTPGFNVFVKERGVLKKINIKPMSSEDALKKGMFVVGTTARASFKITPANAPAQEKFNGGTIFENDFYKSKSGFMVEKASRRIKSSGELQEITFKGIATNKARSGFKSMFSKNKSVFGGRRK